MGNPQANTPVWSERQLAGMAAYNTELRYIYSPPTSLWDNGQRAEFVRILAEAFGVGERNVRTWFSFNQRQTPFLRKDLPEDIFIGRTILAKCLINGDYADDSGRMEYVLVKGSGYNLQGAPLQQLLILPNYFEDFFHWEYNGYQWNLKNGNEPEDTNSFWLIWYYGYIEIPWWLPSHLRPFPDLDDDPFGEPEA